VYLLLINLYYYQDIARQMSLLYAKANMLIVSLVSAVEMSSCVCFVLIVLNFMLLSYGSVFTPPCTYVLKQLV